MQKFSKQEMEKATLDVPQPMGRREPRDRYAYLHQGVNSQILS